MGIWVRVTGSGEWVGIPVSPGVLFGGLFAFVYSSVGCFYASGNFASASESGWGGSQRRVSSSVSGALGVGLGVGESGCPCLFSSAHRCRGGEDILPPSSVVPARLCPGSVRSQWFLESLFFLFAFLCFFSFLFPLSSSGVDVQL